MYSSLLWNCIACKFLREYDRKTLTLTPWAYIIQNCIVNRFPNIPCGRSMFAGAIICEFLMYSYLLSKYQSLFEPLFFMNVHSLYFKFEQSKKILFGRVNNIYNVHILRLYHMSIFQWILLHAPSKLSKLISLTSKHGISKAD